MNVRISNELFDLLGGASVKFSMEKCEIVRCALRKFRRLKPVGVDECIVSTTYGGHVMDVYLTPELRDATGDEVRKALLWYLELHKNAPATPRFETALVAGVDYKVKDESDDE